jgi:hypothetical protein
LVTTSNLPSSCSIWRGQRTKASFRQSPRGVFQTLQQQGVARFTAIGIDAAALGLPMDSVPWSEDTEAQEIARLDVGLEWLPSPLAGEGLGERGLVGLGLGGPPSP